MTIKAILSALVAAIENNSAIEAEAGESVLFDGVECVHEDEHSVIVDFTNGRRARICVSLMDKC